jgi:hypothetical protein
VPAVAPVAVAGVTEMTMLRVGRIACCAGVAAGITWLAGVQPAGGAVLPDDRMDMLYHYYDGGGITVDGPSVLVRRKLGESFSVQGKYHVDTITGASIDVVTTASEYREERTELAATVDYLRGDTLLSVGTVFSDENDYKGRSFSVGVSQEVFAAMTTLSMAYVRNADQVGRTGDPDFAEDLDRHSWRLGLTQVVTRNMLAELAFETIADKGFLNNPYRQVRYVDGESARGYSLQSELYPRRRLSNAAAVRGRYHLPYRAAVHAEYRFYTDDWGIDAHTARVGYTHATVPRFIFDVQYRYYTQVAADFWSDLYPFRNAQNFLARDKELSSYTSHSVRLGVSYELFARRIGFMERGSVNATFDRITADYPDFRDLRAGVDTPGDEPGYKLTANVFQVFFSIWF